MLKLDIPFQITIEDIARMKKKNLYDYGVASFDDAKLILQQACGHRSRSPVRERSGSQGNRVAEGELSQKHCENPGNEG